MVNIVLVPAPTKRAWANSAELPDGRSSRTGPNLNGPRHSASAPPPTQPVGPDTYGQSRLPRPKAVAGPWGTQIRQPWADTIDQDGDDEEEEEEDNAMQTADESPPLTVSPRRSKCGTAMPPSTLGASKGTPASGSQSAFQRRIAEMEAQKQADRAELEALRASTDAQLEKLKKETEATVMDMLNQISDVHASMKTLETSLHHGLAAQTLATSALGDELREMLQQLLAKSKSKSKSKSPSPSRDSRSPRRGSRSKR